MTTTLGLHTLRAKHERSKRKHHSAAARKPQLPQRSGLEEDDEDNGYKMKRIPPLGRPSRPCQEQRKEHEKEFARIAVIARNRLVTESSCCKDRRRVHDALADIEPIDGEAAYWQARWMHRRGKGPEPLVQRAQLQKMRMWFRSLDYAADGTVGVDDLLDPLISVGLARTRNDVINLLGVALGEKEDDDPSITLNDLFQVLQRKEVSTQVERAHAAPARPLRQSRQRAQQSPGPRRAVTVDGRAVEDALRCEAQARMASFFELLSGGPPGASGQQLTVPLIIASHRRQMLLQANCAPPGSAAHREGKLILDALARVRADAPTPAVSHRVRDSAHENAKPPTPKPRPPPPGPGALTRAHNFYVQAPPNSNCY